MWQGRTEEPRLVPDPAVFPSTGQVGLRGFPPSPQVRSWALR